MLTSKREVIIGADEQKQLLERFTEARRKDPAEAARLQAVLAQKCCSGSISYGEARAIDKKSHYVSSLSTTADKLSAVMRWYPEKDYLRVRADVTDASFSTDSPKDKPWEKSCIEVFVCPTGLDEDISQFFVVPEGPRDKPRIKAVRHMNAGIDEKGLKAWWKRTEKGYVIDLRIPWDKLSGYNKNWKVMPVEIGFESSTPDGAAQMMMNSTKQPWSYAKGYAALKRK